MKACQLKVVVVTVALASLWTSDVQARRTRRHPHIKSSQKHLSRKHRARRHPLVGRHVSGVASWSQRTSRMVTAARGVPRGSKLWVWRHGTPSKHGTAVWVNDSGPYVGGRVLDLSTGAFRRVFGNLGRGHGPVHYKVLKVGT